MNVAVVSDMSRLHMHPARRQGPPGAARVLFIHSMFSGLATYAHELTEYTRTRDDVEATHVYAGWPLWAKIAGKALPQGVLPGWDLHAYRKLVAFRHVMNSWLDGPLRGREFDVVFIMSQGIALSALEIPRRRGWRVALNIDATGESEVRDFGYARWTRAPFIRAERAMFEAADLICPWTRWAAASLASDYDVPIGKIVVAPGGMRVPPNSGAARVAGGTRDAGDRPARIAFVGNDWERKGGPRLIAWHQQRWASRAELHVFSSRAPADRDARNVVWHGEVARGELLEHQLPRMDLLVLPTREDTFGWAALEASAVGLPVVTSHLAGIPEVVVDGETGLLVPPGDDIAFVSAVEALLANPFRRRGLGAEGHRRVRDRLSRHASFGPMLDSITQIARSCERSAGTT